MKELIEFARRVEKGDVILPEYANYDQVKIVLRSRLPLEDKIAILEKHYWDTHSKSKKQALMVKKVISYLTRLRSREEQIAGILAFVESLPAPLRKEAVDEVKKLRTEYWSVILVLHPELA